MFRTNTCPACVQMQPILERVATNMKSIGVKVGCAFVDNAPELSRTFQIHAVPKLMLFVPRKAPIEYQSERSPKAIGQFIISHLPGQSQITTLNTDERLDNFFNASRTAPRVILFSKKTTIPALFKHLCYQHRRGIRCGFASQSSSSLPKIVSRLQEIGEFDDKKLTYPSIYAYNRTAAVPIRHYEGAVELAELNDFFNEYDAVNQTTEIRSSTPKTNKKEEQKTTPPPSTPPKPKKPAFSFDLVNQSNYKDTCLTNHKLCLLFFFDQSETDEQKAAVHSSVEATLREHYYNLGYTFLYTDAQSTTQLPEIKDLLSSQPSLQEGHPGVLVLNKIREKTASWTPPAEGPQKGVEAWQMLPNFMDRLLGGEIRFTKLAQTEGAKKNEL